MNTTIKKLMLLTLVFVLSVLALTSCGPSKETPPPTQPPAPAAATQSAGAAPTATKAPAATQAPTKPAATSAPAEEKLSLESRDAALDKLKSYRMRWQAQWKSTEGVTTTTAGWDWTEEYTADPPALHWIWKFTEANTAKPGQMEMWQIGDTTYMVSSDAPGASNCISFSAADKNSALTKGIFSPKSLGSLKDARYVGIETVNGIRTKHYKYDEKTTTLTAFGKVSGDIWVAIDGGYVVKDVMQWQGSAGMFGLTTNAKGEGQWTWELSDVDKPIPIKPPENCGGASAGVPMLPDAKDKTTFGDMVSYSSATKLADAAAFYKKEMAAAGWKLEGDPVVAGNTNMLSFTKDAQKAQVIITAEQNKTTVVITITK